MALLDGRRVILKQATGYIGRQLQCYDVRVPRRLRGQLPDRLGARSVEA